MKGTLPAPPPLPAAHTLSFYNYFAVAATEKRPAAGQKGVKKAPSLYFSFWPFGLGNFRDGAALLLI